MQKLPTSANSSSMRELWESMENGSTGITETALSSSSSLYSSVAYSSETTARAVNWLIENRGGIAFLTGALMVPSQFMGPNFNESNDIIDAVCASNNAEYTVEKFNINLLDGGNIGGVICIPKNWDPADKSKCVVYNNGNGITTPGYFNNNVLGWTPKEILKIRECPLILYDYRGTGLSQDNETNFSSASRFLPTHKTITDDGFSVLCRFAKEFDSLEIWGSSLGGGVATVALERYLEANSNDAGRMALTNHDSFATTARVMVPKIGIIADGLGLLVGGQLNAFTPMQSLLQRGIKVTILCHQQDPVIPQGARMAEFVAPLFPQYNNLSFVYSPLYGHANLSSDMINQLKQTDDGENHDD